MVFFISVIIVAILYFLQTEGLIYVTIVAVVGELINIFMIHTLTKSIEKKSQAKARSIIARFQKKLQENKKTIKELERVRDDSVKKIFDAHKKIDEYEKELQQKSLKGEPLLKDDPPAPSPGAAKPDTAATANHKEGKPSRKEFIDLPSGSNRKKKVF